MTTIKEGSVLEFPLGSAFHAMSILLVSRPRGDTMTLNSTQPLDPRQLFYEGRCEEVLGISVDSPGTDWMNEHIPYAIGALSFLGRVEEADFRFHKGGLSQRLTVEERSACLFYMAVGWVRNSNYAKARSYIVQNLLLCRSHKESAEVAAFARQGQAFYRYFCGRYSHALRAAERALESAIVAHHFFIRMFATDLLGHSRVQMGEIARGLQDLELAHKLAQRLGHGSYEKAIFRAILSFRVQYGILGEDNLGVLSELIQESKVEDTFTDSYMVMELARQLTVRGQVSRAEEWLRKVSHQVNASGQRWQRALMNLRFAEIAYQRRNEIQIRETLDLARADIDGDVDLSMLVFWQGLAIKAGLYPSDEFLATHQRDTQRLHSGISLRIAARRLSQKHHVPVGEDPLGDFMDSLSPPPPGGVFQHIVKSGYLGLLRNWLPPIASRFYIYYHHASQTLVLGRDGDVFAAEAAASSKLFELLKSLYKGFRTKEELIRDVWGYEYNPLRHDSLLYTLISRFRSLLGPCADWLENHDEGYGVMADVEMILGDLRMAQMPATAPREDLAHSDFNTRQFAILELMKKDRKSMSLDECADLFSVSKVTATRDFSSLCKTGHLRRVGKGPATRYILGVQGL
ncbi:MAG: DeoR family transcriptional regulator [Proteobacteria bacterium]|nr:MAG: DeoR family transcriptional regulator [Pseudomonadota bacterium]